MNNIFVSIGPVNIYWYAILILISLIIGFILCKKESIKCSLGSTYMTDLAFPLIIYAIVGARLYYVLFNWDYYGNNFFDIFKIWEGGLAIYGGIIGGILATLIYTKKRGTSFLLTLDILMPALILGQAIGRWGNFINQEAYGKVVSFEFLQKLHLPNFIIDGMYINGTYHHPTFLYESILCLIGFLLLIILRKVLKEINIGTITGIYLIYYGTIRFFIEIIRTDSLYLGSFKVSMIVSVILFVSGLILLLSKNKRGIYQRTGRA